MSATVKVMHTNILPHREEDTAVLQSVQVPKERAALFLTLGTEMLHDKVTNEMSFVALSPKERSLFQLLLYLTYSCKGQLFQVTLENPDFTSMSPPIREDFAHGRLFCFVLDMAIENPCNTTCQTSSTNIDVRCRPDTQESSTLEEGHEYLSGPQLFRLMNVSVDMDVFRTEDGEDDVREGSDNEECEYRSMNHTDVRAGLDAALEEAYNAFMRLQLVRLKVSSLNNAMIVMRDSQRELGSIFEWLDISSDTINSNAVDKKKVKELNGSMYTPACHSGRNVTTVPQPIACMTLKSLKTSIGHVTDSCCEGEGKTLFLSLLSTLTSVQWLKQGLVERSYNSNLAEDVRYVRRLMSFTDKLSCSSGSRQVDTMGLLVFKYSLETLIAREAPDLFVRCLIHRHVPIATSRIENVLSDIRRNRRTQKLARALERGQCHCKSPDGQASVLHCRGDCQTAYSCFYNLSETHPFVVSGHDHSYYFAHIYPHLAKLERLSKEMKIKYRGRTQFESISDMVFNILVRRQFGENESLYEGLGRVIDEDASNSSLSLGHCLSDLHQWLCLAPCAHEDYSREHGALDPIKQYDQAVVRYLFCDSLQVGRLFQASTTFNYIISNTAPRYTIERIMLFNVTGPGEGKSFANNVLNYQFGWVKDCIETLTSFTPMAFKYKEKRVASVVIIDDAHISHEKNVRSVDKESNIIPNTFKNLLDTSTLHSDVVTRDLSSGKVDTVKYQAVHNCGFVWNTNTLGFVSDAWADRCLIMESEFPESVSRTRSTVQIRAVVESQDMERIAAVCLYRQNLIQSATMIAESDIMQFSARFDKARDTCLSALFASHILCMGKVSRRVSFCINQLVFAEAMKLACHFVFDVWIPPWTKIPDPKDFHDLGAYMKQMNKNRLKALNKLSFGQICLETNAVYKLCTAACLPDLCPRAVDTQARFACKVLGYILTQVHEQHLKTSVKSGHLVITGIDAMCFPETVIKGGTEVAHEMLTLCSACNVPARLHARNLTASTRSYKLCTYRYATTQNTAHMRRNHSNIPRKVGSVTVPLEAVYDLLALCAPDSHSGFWDQLRMAMGNAYARGNFEKQELNAFGQYVNESEEEEEEGDREQQSVPRLIFTLDFNGDPVRSLVLEATAAIKPLNELTFSRSVLGGELFQCSAPLYYGNALARVMSPHTSQLACNKEHQRESKLGPRGTFHGPRLSVYSIEYAGLPVANVSSFCTTRTVYDQGCILLRAKSDNRRPLAVLDEDWEWKDAADVFNRIHGADVFSVEMLKKDYAATMLDVKGETLSAQPGDSGKLRATITVLQVSRGCAALALRRGVKPDHKTQEQRKGMQVMDDKCKKNSRKHKMTNGRRYPDSTDTLSVSDKKKRTGKQNVE